MIPIRDEIKTHRVPVVNYILILVNVAVFLWAYVLNANPDAVYSQYALIPSQIRQGLDLGDMRNILTSMFMHAGWFHLLGNMLYLWIFGDNIEDRLGHIGYLLFYLAGGFVAAFAHFLAAVEAQDGRRVAEQFVIGWSLARCIDHHPAGGEEFAAHQRAQLHP